MKYDREKVLVVGAAGLIGQALHNELLLNPRYNVVGATRDGRVVNGVPTISMDIGDPSSTHKTVRSLEPSIIINAAGLVSVVGCEQSPEIANTLNNLAVSYLLAALDKTPHGYFVNISTDAVFGANPGRLHPVDKTPAPLNVYGRTKRAGEEVCEKSGVKYLIARTSVVYGSPKNDSQPMRPRFIDSVKTALINNQPFQAMNDVYNSPTALYDVVRGIVHLMSFEKSGTYHVAGPTRMSKYDLAREIAEALGKDTNLIVPTTRSAMGNIYPHDTSLCIKQLNAVQYFPDSHSEGIKHYLQ